MSELNFRIIIVPVVPYTQEGKNILLSNVKTKLQNCLLEVRSIKFFQAKKSEEEDHPEIEELIIQVHATCIYLKEKHLQYSEFCSMWKNETDSLFCSYIELYSNESFMRSRKSHSEITYQELRFGVLPHDGNFYQYDCVKASSTGDTIIFYHDSRNVVIKRGGYELLFPYDNIRNIFVNIRSNSNEILFDLFNPPVINRITNHTNRYFGPYTLKHRNINMSLEIDTDVLGRANVLCISIIGQDMMLNKIISNIHYRCSEKSVLYSSINSVNRNKPLDPLIDNMDFSCTYLMTAIYKRNFVLMTQSPGAAIGLSKLIGFSKENPNSLEKALTDVLLALDSGKILNYWHAIENRYNFYNTKKNNMDLKQLIVPSKCCLIRRITLTPTRQLLWPPELLFGNRVVRKFDSDYAIRVSFRDDNMQKLSFCGLYADPGVLESCINKPMTNGLSIGSRYYEFLAWSNSQIRDHGVWMYARNSEGKNSAEIRKWMGDFSHIHNVSKYMARMGQCFSQTEDALSVPLNPTSVKTESDIEGGYDPVNYKPYCFSDGVGKISVQLAQEVHSVLGHDKLCSAFQIRYKGYKGMLVIDPTLKDVQMSFRQSMKKFDCPNSSSLEIARTSSPIPLQLNRPFIAILNDLGVRHRVFLRLQETMLKDITDMLFDEERASKCLKAKTPLEMINYQDVSQSGIHLTTEPFFRAVLLSLHGHQIEIMKSKANIAIGPEYGRNMLGVIDETGSLNYGEVFVQYSTDVSYGETTRETTILKCQVLVTKNPCHYPGDVRKFQAVDIPNLHHIVDCIVFPQRGRRPHPNEMAGSDLDGDEYAVLWDPDLIFYCPNREPAHFEEMKSIDVHGIGVPDMINFLQEYIKKDQVGAISHAHLALVDKHGIDDKLCLSVARKISIAVDFAKSGKCEPLEKHERPKIFPDFMEKNYGERYKSEKALGKMYRICRDYETENKETNNMYKEILVDPDLIYPGWEDFKEEAIKSRNKYNLLLRSLLRNYGVENESEAFSGSFSKVHCRFQERKDRNEIQKVILLCIKKLMKSTLEEFLEEFISFGDVPTMEKAMLQKASAWYVVTYSNPDAKLLSFPWTVYKYLSNIKILSVKPSPFSPTIVRLDEKILECENSNLLPEYEETYIWNQYLFICNPKVIQRALRVLILWAQDEEIIETPNYSQGLMYVDKFIQLFLHVAELFKYVAKKNDYVDNGNESYSPGKFCIEFLKFCSSLRFYNKSEIYDILPFNVYKYSKLAKRAVVSYHMFALSGILRNLYFDRKVKEDVIEMKPYSLDSKIFSQYIRNDTQRLKTKAILVEHSKVEEIRFREHFQTKKVWISAWGTERSIKDLKSILGKKHSILKQLFDTGVMPENTVSDVGRKRLLDSNSSEPIAKSTKF